MSLPALDLFAPADPAAPEPGFWLLPRDAACTVAEIKAEAWGIRLTCAACRRARHWPADPHPGLAPDLTMAALARRAVCGDPDCGSRQGVLTVLRPARRTIGGHVTDRDLARIRALAEAVTPTFSPPILDDLDAPLRVGAFMPGEEAYEGGHVFGAWAGRVLVGWRITQSAKNARRKVGR